MKFEAEQAKPSIAPALAAVAAPPIPTAQAWLRDYDGACGPAVDMSQAVPGYAPPEAFTDAFRAATGHAEDARYGAILGNDALRSAYAGHVSGLYGCAIAAQDVGITAGCNQAFFASVMCVAGSGDSVLLPTPWYFNQQMTLAMLGIEPVPVPTLPQDGFLPSVAAVEAAITPRTRALVLVTPNNPTGAICPPERIAALYAVCAAHGIVLILDETYRDFLAPGTGAPHGLFERPDWRDGLIALYSFSKAYAIPGHRLGAMIAGPRVLDAAGKVLDCIQICPSRPSQAALAPSIESTAAWRADKAADVRARAALFRAAMAADAPAWRIEQAGAYFAYVRHPFSGMDAVRVARHLGRRYGLLTLPGSFFGPGQEDYLRIAFANVDAAGISAFAARLGSVTAPERLKETA
ncbi:aminotransferase [Aureimonas frigidaquae]|uniref:Aminotransferase n=1 Tax=Aureimonas frigidaquae TaxID=424757 RepID=A0A0P0Z109_9HYPH|nr:aminotransferase [Aureimonas frigidaquae]BAT27719.1 aspartate/tyrosine/aromatic aminotransferase [Aureimonas frigidaquae]